MKAERKPEIRFFNHFSVSILFTLSAGWIEASKLFASVALWWVFMFSRSGMRTDEICEFPTCATDFVQLKSLFSKHYTQKPYCLECASSPFRCRCVRLLFTSNVHPHLSQEYFHALACRFKIFLSRYVVLIKPIITLCMF